jgi:YD repeat-containing protein
MSLRRREKQQIMRKTQPSIRNANKVAKDVYSHSGEFSPRETDLEIPCRGVSFALTRSYHSELSSDKLGFGKGWTFNYAKRLKLNDDNSISYFDGYGRNIIFELKEGAYLSPDGIYAQLEKKEDSIVLRKRKGIEYHFEKIGRDGQGGRLTKILDSNKNTLDFKYSEDSILIKDSFNRETTLFQKTGRIVAVQDHRERKWEYVYNNSGQLIEVKQPKRADFPNGTSIKYDYDESGKLNNIISPNGLSIVKVEYNQAGKVIKQEWGTGTYRFKYDNAKLALTLPNGGIQLFTHNEMGLVEEKVVRVSSNYLNEADRDNGDTTYLITKSEYNKNGELIRREFPTGNKKFWKYDDHHNSPLDRGNLLAQKHESSKREEPIVKKFKGYNAYQKATEIINEEGNRFRYKYDQRGNLIKKTYPRADFKDLSSNRNKRQILTFKFEYNEGGQMISKVDGKGIRTDYIYYKVDDYPGKRGDGSVEDRSKAGGYLAKVIKYADSDSEKIVTSYQYNDLGKITKVTDGRGNSTLNAYDDLGKIIEVKASGPSFHTKQYSYDANGNVITKVYRFERKEWDAEKKKVIKSKGKIIEQWEYDELNNTTKQSITSGDQELSQAWKRNESHKVKEIIFPDGSKNTFKYDERNLIIEQVKKGSKTSFTHTKSGKVRSQQIEKSKPKVYHYDGFDRLAGCEYPNGIIKKQRINKLGIVENIELFEDNKIIFSKNKRYDKVGRLVKESEVLFEDHNSGTSPEERAILFQYNKSNKPSKIKTLSGNVLRLVYDQANRLIQYGNKQENRFLTYDENGNLIKDVRTSTQQVEEVNREFDEANRLVAIQRGNRGKVNIKYNELGKIEELVDGEGSCIHFLYDNVGRIKGAYQFLADGDVEKHLRSFIEIEGAQVKTFTNRPGQKFQYEYEPSSGRISKIQFPDGTHVKVEWTADGRIESAQDRKGQQTHFSYDEANRLNKLQVENTTTEFRLNALNQIENISQSTPQHNHATQRTYDSLSRLKKETTNDTSIHTQYDDANNVIAIICPDGTKMVFKYDKFNRLISSSVPAKNIKNTYEYSIGGKLSKKVLSDKYEQVYHYEEGTGRMISTAFFNTTNGNELYRYEYVYDEAGRLEEEQLYKDGQLEKRYNYSRDRIGRVKRINAENESIDVELDAMNRVEKINSASFSFEASTDRMQRYAQYGNRNFKYDGNGNRIEEVNQDSEHCRTKEYEYDAQDRLIKVTCRNEEGDETKRIELFYDSSNRVVQKQVIKNGKTITTTYVWWNNFLIQKKVTEGEQTTTETYLPGENHADTFFKEERGNTTRYVSVYDGRSRNTATIDVLNESDTTRYDYLPSGGMKILPSRSQQGPVDTVNGVFDLDLGFFNNSVHGGLQSDSGIGWSDQSFYGDGVSYGWTGDMGVDVFGHHEQPSFSDSSGIPGAEALTGLATNFGNSSNFYREHVARGGNPGDLMNPGGNLDAHGKNWLDHASGIVFSTSPGVWGVKYGIGVLAGETGLAAGGVEAGAALLGGASIGAGLVAIAIGVAIYIYVNKDDSEENNSLNSSPDNQLGGGSDSSSEDEVGGDSIGDEDKGGEDNGGEGSSSSTEEDDKPKDPEKDEDGTTTDGEFGSDGSLPPPSAVEESLYRQLLMKLRNANFDPEYAGGGIGFNEQQVFAEQGGLVADPPPGERLRSGGGIMPNQKQLVIDIDPRLNRM